MPTDYGAEISELDRTFDGDWYLARYPDVAASGMSAAEHFLWIGKRLGRVGSAQNQASASLTGERALSQFQRPTVHRWSIEAFQRDQRIDFAERLEFTGPLPHFPYSPLISLILPVYKSPIKFLEIAVKSVIRQSYPKWELCIVDDGSCSFELDDYLAALPDRDARIHVSTNRTNGGIAHASNCCLELAHGEFIALFDHDDILTRDALSENVMRLNRRPGLDFIYSDECRVDEHDHVIDMFRKPDWSSYMLLNSMYTGHFSVYRRSLIARLGGFRSQYDFSQDYDLALRVAEVTDKIEHIAKLLYGWRAIAGSGASGGKDFARETNIAALADAMKRRGISGTAVPLPTANRVDRAGSLPSPLVSIIIPSDNFSHISAAISAIVDQTSYLNYEIIIVTNSHIIAKMAGNHPNTVQFCPFDSIFNFSAKCNAGANCANGEFFIFFNDDVRPRTKDWVECLLEYGLLADVGAVGPKLLYEDSTIQHAGMVTGVRNLVGTAFHCLPSNTSAHFNMAQYVREVSLICGAVVMLRRSVFHAIGGWDETDFAIAHSDIDLCLKVWDAGFKCLYTPYSELLHIGHVSIGHEEKKQIIRKKDKADISFLRKWPQQAAYDPYWPPELSRGVYADSQELFQVFAGNPHPLRAGSDILIASHEMTQSGAPQIVAELARVLRNAGHFVTVIAPAAGPLCSDLNKLGITVIVDELLLENHDSVRNFCSNFDIVIANTVVMWPLVKQIQNFVPIKWYIHESNFLKEYIPNNGIVYQELAETVEVWAVTSVPGRILASLGWRSKILLPGLSAFDCKYPERYDANVINILILGGYEPRKGQDLAISMLEHLPTDVTDAIDIVCRGRVVDQSFFTDIKLKSINLPNIRLLDGIPRSLVCKAISEHNIVLVPSRDESFSLVALEALMVGSIVICSREVGISEYMGDGVDGFIADSPAPVDLAAALERALVAKNRWPEIRANGKTLARTKFGSSAFSARVLDLVSDCVSLE